MIKYNSAYFQIILVGLICFCCPGMFNVQNSIGAGGLVSDDNVSKNANAALNSLFAIFGILGGGIVNMFGTKWSMAISGLTYAFYASSFLIYNATGAGWVVILAGALLGIGAGILWSAQGAIMMSYATESTKGKYISTFWIVFNLGSVLGSILPFAINFNNVDTKLNPNTFIAFIVIMAIGCAIALFLVPQENVIKEDGSKVQTTKFENVFSEFISIGKVFLDWKMLALIPLFISSNWFYTYQFDFFNGVIFNIRTRPFNSIWYWAMQMIGSLGIGKLLDYEGLSRSRRGLYALALLTVMFTVVWGAGLAVQLTYTRENNPYVDKKLGLLGIDFTESSRYAGLLILYMFYGLLDAMLQTLAYWVMGSMSNDAAVLTRYAGFYKGFQSAGAAIVWGIAATDISYLAHLIICWALLEISVPFTFLVIRNIPDYGDEADNHVTSQDIDLNAKA